jgi:hypothetical protein
MDPLHDFDQDLRWVFDSCANQIKTYPAILQEPALVYLNRYNVFQDGFHKNYICYLLPFWLGRAWAVDIDICRKISLASLYKYFYFLIQDAVMDALPGEYKADLLPLGNLFYLDFIEIYRDLLPDDSLFWQSMMKYVQQWAYSTLWEREEHWSKRRLVTEADLVIVAHKAAPLKIINAAMGILSGKPELIGMLDEIIDDVVITSQLLDDWVDWREDFRCGNCTYLLSQVMKRHQLNDFAELNETLIHKTIHFSDILPEMYAMTRQKHTLLAAAVKPSIPYLIAFHENLLRNFNQKLERLQIQKKAILAGGFSRWLAKRHSVSDKNMI